MTGIKCLDNYRRFKEMILKGETGSACYFSSRLKISTRTFFRLIHYLNDIDGLKINYNKANDIYYLE